MPDYPSWRNRPAAGAESVGSISFANTTGYTITGGTLTRSNASIVASNNAAHVSIINSVLAGSTASIGLTKTNAGILSLGGTNTYVGNTTITAGFLRAVDGVGLPASSRLVFDGGTFESSGTFTRANVTSGPGTFGYNGGKNANFSANGGKLTIRIGNDATIAQTISGSNAPAANTFRNLNFLGGTAGNAEVEFQNNLNMGGQTRVIDVQGGDSTGNFFVTISGVISNGGLGRQGSGKMVLTGVNTYSLQTTLNNAGSITVLGNKSALGTGPIVVTGGGALQAGADLSGANKISNALTITSNAFTVSGSNNLDIGGIVTFSGGNRSITSRITGGGLLTLSGTVKLQEDTGSASRFLTIAGTGNTTISGPIVNGGTAGNGGITLTNSGITTLSGANTYTGTTTVSAGTLRIGGSGTLGNVSAGIGNYAGSITIANSRSLVYASSAAQTLGGVISGTGGALTAEAGTLSLTGANTYTGATTVSGGTLLVNGSGSLASAVTVNSGAFGGSGSIGSTLSLLGSSSFHVVDLVNPLQVTGTINLYAGFGVNNLVGIDWSTTAFDTYTLITGSLGAGVFNGLNNNSLATAQNVGSGRIAYFQEGSLQLVVANVPEPSAALLGVLAPLLGTLTLLRRRRRGPCLGPR